MKAEELVQELIDLTVVTVSGALFLAIDKSESRTDYTDYKDHLLYVLLKFSDGSRLKIHRDGNAEARYKGQLIASVNVYKIDTGEKQ